MSFAVRLRGPHGQSTITVTPDMSIAELLSAVSQTASIPEQGLSLRSGFPPKPIEVPQDRSLNASALGLGRGDTLIVASQAPAQLHDHISKSAETPITRAATSHAASTQSRTSATSKQIKGTHVPAPAYGGSLVIRVAPDDNSCLFHALALLLLPDDVNGKTTLRRQISQYIGDNVFDYNEAVLGMPVEQYINTIQKDSTWGGAIELAATSSMYKVEIDAVDIQTGRIDKYGEDQQFANRALMLYSGIHYDSATVSPLPEDAFDQLDFDTRLFASGEGDDILTCLKDLASALRQKHYYTDTSNFTLKCEVCKKGLVGQKEAQSHAMETGHASFGEY